MATQSGRRSPSDAARPKRHPAILIWIVRECRPLDHETCDPNSQDWTTHSRATSLGQRWLLKVAVALRATQPDRNDIQPHSRPRLQHAAASQLVFSRFHPVAQTNLDTLCQKSATPKIMRRVTKNDRESKTDLPCDTSHRTKESALIFGIFQKANYPDVERLFRDLSRINYAVRRCQNS